MVSPLLGGSPLRSRVRPRFAPDVAWEGLLQVVLCRLRHNLRINRDLHFVANDDDAGFEQLVPAQTKVLAIELSGCAETGSIIPVRILGEALERCIESDFLRYAVKREVLHRE